MPNKAICIVHFVEKSCKRLCADNSDEKMTVGTEEENSDLTKGANSVLDERQSLHPDDKFLNNLSQDCCTFYKQLGRQLGVTHEKIEEINKDHVNYSSLPDKCFQMFQAWKDSNDNEFTMEVLEKALRDLNKNRLANKHFGKK